MVHYLVAAILVQESRILLGHRSPTRAFYPNVWDVFGGHIEPNEQPDQTLIREVQEELGVTPTRWKKLATMHEFVSGQIDTPPDEMIVHVYWVTAWTGTPVNRQPEEHSVIQWFSYAEAIQLDLADPAYPRLFAKCLGTTDHDPLNF